MKHYKSYQVIMGSYPRWAANWLWQVWYDLKGHKADFQRVPQMRSQDLLVKLGVVPSKSECFRAGWSNKEITYGINEWEIGKEIVFIIKADLKDWIREKIEPYVAQIR